MAFINRAELAVQKAKLTQQTSAYFCSFSSTENEGIPYPMLDPVYNEKTVNGSSWRHDNLNQSLSSVWRCGVLFTQLLESLQASDFG